MIYMAEAKMLNGAEAVGNPIAVTVLFHLLWPRGLT